MLGGISRRLLRPSTFRRTRSQRAAMAASGGGSGGLDDSRGLAELVGYLDSLRNFEREGVPRDAGTDTADGFDLGRMRRLLRRLGDPHNHYMSVHVAGTKGKGSTVAFLSSILREEGYNVGCYTSPHLLSLRERITLGRSGNPISDELLGDIFCRVKGTIAEAVKYENGSLTHFEVFTALAFVVFSIQKVDIAVIEAGLGGARDATNVIQSTELLASIITSIGKEHLAALGGSLESIAVAKSGIIKEGRPVIIGGPFLAHIEEILHRKASLMKSPVVSACNPGIQTKVKSFIWEDERPYQNCDILINIQEDMNLNIEMRDLKLKLLGDRQVQNAVTATSTALCLRAQGWSISERSIRAGLENAWLPARSQFLTEKETSVLGQDCASIILDGAHTEASAEALASLLSNIKLDGPLALVVAMASDKEHLAFARKLLSGRTPDMVILTETTIAGAKSRAMTAHTLKDIWIKSAKDQDIPFVDIGTITDLNAPTRLLPQPEGAQVLIGCQNAEISDLLMTASRFLRSRASGHRGLICVTGSLHIAAAVLRVFDHRHHHH